MSDLRLGLRRLASGRGRGLGGCLTGGNFPVGFCKCGFGEIGEVDWVKTGTLVGERMICVDSLSKCVIRTLMKLAELRLNTLSCSRIVTFLLVVVPPDMLPVPPAPVVEVPLM